MSTKVEMRLQSLEEQVRIMRQVLELQSEILKSKNAAGGTAEEPAFEKRECKTNHTALARRVT